MFGLIALGLFAASTISSTTLIGGGVVVAGATAYGLKKYCDKVEEDNRLRVLNTQKEFEVKVASIQREADYLLPFCNQFFRMKNLDPKEARDNDSGSCNKKKPNNDNTSHA